jgi:hypothetical protein
VAKLPMISWTDVAGPDCIGCAAVSFSSILECMGTHLCREKYEKRVQVAEARGKGQTRYRWIDEERMRSK